MKKLLIALLLFGVCGIMSAVDQRGCPCHNKPKPKPKPKPPAEKVQKDTADTQTESKR